MSTADPLSLARGATPPLAAPADAPLAAYLLAEPFLAGKVVLDIGPRPARAAERLARAGAREVVSGDGPGPLLELADRTVDVVLCVARLAAAAGEVERHRWLAEVRRVLRPDGFCLLRFPCADGFDGAALGELLRHHFGLVELVSETPLAGVSFIAPATDEVAVNEELARIGGEPTHILALCAAGAPRPWSVPESLLVPLRGAGAVPVLVAPEEVAALREEIEGLVARHEAACHERDALRETLMIIEDRADQHEEALSALRREAERHLRQISDDAAALELATLERERLERRAASAERALEAQAAQLQQRTAELVALERELSRARAPGRNGT